MNWRLRLWWIEAKQAGLGDHDDCQSNCCSLYEPFVFDLFDSSSELLSTYFETKKD